MYSHTSLRRMVLTSAVAVLSLVALGGTALAYDEGSAKARVLGYETHVVGDVVCHSGLRSGTVCGGAPISNYFAKYPDSYLP